ncbi:MAG: hypothetical protein KJO07_05805, partial [Deltaproteobacteria bacterium]|nr:hypothetical protein [Deltaproteobacteria bacterium]
MRASIAIAALLVGACSAARPPAEPAGAPIVTGLYPEVILPGTRLVIEGQGFASAGLGVTRVAVRGTHGDGSQIGEMWLPITLATEDRLEVAV